jgi:hypothetical protein
MRFRSTVVFVVLLLCAACTSNKASRVVGSTGPAGVTAASVSSIPSRVSIPPTPKPKDRSRIPTRLVTSVVRLQAYPRGLVAGGGSVFAIAGGPAQGGATPVRLSSTGSITKGAPVLLEGRPPTMLAFAGGAPWVASGSGTYARLDPTTLAAGSTTDAPGRIVELAGSADRLWVAGERWIEGVDPSDGALIRSFTESARILRFAVSPDGTRLYLALAGPVKDDEVPVVELDSSNGAPVAKTYEGVADLAGVSGLTPTPGGVWITYPTGMMGSSVFARASNLHHWTGEVGHEGLITGTNALQVWWAANIMWATSGSGGLLCVETDGQEKALFVENLRPHDFTGIYGDVVSVGDRVYLGLYRSIARIDPPHVCRSG